MLKIIFVIFSVLLLASTFSELLANGGDQRVVEGTYLINLSRAPFTPRAGEKVSMLVSFVDIEKSKLIAEDITAKIRIAKLGGKDGKREFLFEQDNIPVKGGVLEFSYTFADSGLHEIFFDFTLASNPQKIYEAPDFLLDVQKADSQRARLWVSVAIGVGGAILGVALGLLLKKPIRIK